MAATAAPGLRVLTCRRLVVAAAAGLVVLSLGQATLRGDREALALAVVIVIGLVLLRRGTGTLGVVFLSLVFGDFLVWTMWAAMNNLRHGEQPEDVTLPALLAVLSLTGLLACWAALARRRQPQAGGLAVAVTPAAAVFVVAMLLGFAVAYPEAPRPSTAGRWWPRGPQRRLLHHLARPTQRPRDGGTDQARPVLAHLHHRPAARGPGGAAGRHPAR